MESGLYPKSFTPDEDIIIYYGLKRFGGIINSYYGCLFKILNLNIKNKICLNF